MAGLPVVYIIQLVELSLLKVPHNQSLLQHHHQLGLPVPKINKFSRKLKLEVNLSISTKGQVG